MKTRKKTPIVLISSLCIITLLLGCGSNNNKELLSFNSTFGGEDWEIAIFDFENNVITRATDNLVPDWGATWSPDGSKIAFSSDVDEGIVEEIAVLNESGMPTMDFNGNIITELKERAGHKNIVVTSNDFSELTFLTGKKGQHSGINWVAQDDEPEWSPDGSKIAFTADPEGQVNIYIMDSDGSNVKQITSSPKEDWHPSWSPDGEKIIFTSLRTGTWELHEINIDGTNLRQLTGLDSPTENWRPVWSPNGKKIAFASERDFPTSSWDIYTMNPDGSELKAIVSSPHTEFEPVWSPDSKKIAFASDRHGTLEIMIVDQDGENLTPTGLQGIPSDWIEIKK